MGRGFSPLDELLALGMGAFSPYLQEAMVRLGVLLPFGQAMATLEFFTAVAVGKATVRRLTERAGTEAERIVTEEAERLEREEVPSVVGPPVQQVSADGAMVPLIGGVWAEVKTVAVGTVVSAVEESEAHTEQLSYFSCLADAASFTRLAAGEMHRRGVDTAETVCAISDGAPWLQGFMDAHRSDAVRILDFPHAAEHLGIAAHAVFGPGTAAASEWLGVQLHELKHGDPDTVLADLRALSAEQAACPIEAAQARDGVVSYLEQRRAQLDYAKFLEAGYPIGSGIVESANKLVVEARMKGSGMHWDRAQVNPMLALRSALLSGRWDPVWQQLWPRLRCRRLPKPAVMQEAQSEGPCAPEKLSSAAPARPARRSSPKRLPSIPLPRKGLVVDGHPTSNHPWKRGLLTRPKLSAPVATDAKK